MRLFELHLCEFQLRNLCFDEPYEKNKKETNRKKTFIQLI